MLRNSWHFVPKSPGESTPGYLPPAVNFCGETMPIQRTEVSDRWRQILRSHSRRPGLLYAIRQRAMTCFPVVDPILKEYGIPADFRYMMVAESELEQRATSAAGAVGYWQFMPQTARELGLRVGRSIDERCDLRKATIAACKHIKYLYNEVGSWPLAAAAYNSGAGHVSSRMKAQGRRNYYALNLHDETNLYLYRVLFFKEVLTRPQQYALLIPTRALQSLTRPILTKG